MSGRGSGHASGSQRRPSNQRPPPQAYHEDTYLRASSYELSDDEISHMRANRHLRVPGLTPHHDTPRYMPSSSSPPSRSSTILRNVGSDVGLDSLDEPLAQQRIHEARASGLNTERRNPSWPFREPAETAMFTPASTSVYLYPMDINIPSGPPARLHDQRERLGRPVANEPVAVASSHEHDLRPQVPPPPSERHRTQSNSFCPDPHRQQPGRRQPARSGPATIDDDRAKQPQYND